MTFPWTNLSWAQPVKEAQLMEATTVNTRDIAAIFISRIKCDNWSMCPLYLLYIFSW